MNWLPRDYCRCHSRLCEMRMNCLRYLLRNEGGETTPHADSLSDEDDSCEYQVKSYDDSGPDCAVDSGDRAG